MSGASQKCLFFFVILHFLPVIGFGIIGSLDGRRIGQRDLFSLFLQHCLSVSTKFRFYRELIFLYEISVKMLVFAHVSRGRVEKKKLRIFLTSTRQVPVYCFVSHKQSGMRVNASKFCTVGYFAVFTRFDFRKFSAFLGWPSS